MRPPEDDVLLRDRIDHARKAIAATRGRSREDLELDDLLAAGMERFIEVVGGEPLGDVPDVEGLGPRGVERLLEEAELFCQRHFPLPGRVEPDRLQRVDRPLVPPEATREILVKALIHRDDSIAGGAVSLAIFDDRAEVWSAGRFPNGITPELLTRAHPSVQRNPILAEVFHRAGLIEKWGRGTNRLAEMCRGAGIAPPEFEEAGGAAVVTIRVPVTLAGVRRESRPESRPESSRALESAVLRLLEAGPLPRVELSRQLGQKQVPGQLKVAMKALLAQGRITYAIPEKAGSRSQKYRLVKAEERG